jgi:hypothetical protein
MVPLQQLFSVAPLTPASGEVMEALHYKARAHRNAVEIAAVLTRQNGRTQDIVIDNLSVDGCRIHGYFLVGDLLKLKLPKIGELEAQVRWAIFGRAGLRFIRNEAR